PLSRRDYEGLRTLSGAAPVTKRSGKSLIVVRRYAAHVRLRDTVYHWARVATQRDPKCRTQYTALRKRGHSHGRALRGVADRLLALACVLLQRQTLFDPSFGRPTAQPATAMISPGRPRPLHAAANSFDCRFSSGRSSEPQAMMSLAARAGRFSNGLLRRASSASRPSFSLR